MSSFDPTLDPTFDVNSKYSYMELLASLDPESDAYRIIYDTIAKMSYEEQLRFNHAWKYWGRPKQQPPDDCSDPDCGCEGNWTLWLLLAGRAFGKTRTGAEWVHEVADKYPGCRIAIIAPTQGDARRVMIEGESGIENTERPWNPCEYFPSKTQIEWANGCIAGVFSADEANRLRGPQHHFVWADEICSWPKVDDVWNMMKLGLRLPRRSGWPADFRPQVVATTTPIATEFIRKLSGLLGFKKAKRTHVTTGSTYENRRNLDPDYFASVITDLEGTRLGQQELLGHILVDVPGALWKSHMIDPFRITDDQLPDGFKSVVVSIDPAAGGDAATGIMVTATGPAPGGKLQDITEHHSRVNASLRKGQRVHGYVLADLSVKGTPDEWARVAMRAYHEFEANAMVAESNNGGDMVRYTLSTIDSTVPVKLVHASRGKRTRAEPVVALFEQGRVHIVNKMAKLENELLTWDPDIAPHSPDRLDAMVWGLHHLMGKGKIHKIPPPISVGIKPNPWAIIPGSSRRP